MKNFSFFICLIINFFLTNGQEDFYFTKTLNDESFETDLIPSKLKFSDFNKYVVKIS